MLFYFIDITFKCFQTTIISKVKLVPLAQLKTDNIGEISQAISCTLIAPTTCCIMNYLVIKINGDFYTSEFYKFTSQLTPLFDARL